MTKAKKQGLLLTHIPVPPLFEILTRLERRWKMFQFAERPT